MKNVRSKTGARQLQKELLDARPPRAEIAFLLQDWDDPYNVGGLFRVADAVGASEVVLSGKTPAPGHPQVSVTSLGAHRRVLWRAEARYLDAVAAMRERGWSPVAVEIADDAVDYAAFDYPPKTLLVLGAEGAGVSDSLLRACDAAVVIPMAGKGRSMNVHVAAAVVAFRARYG